MYTQQPKDEHEQVHSCTFTYAYSFIDLDVSWHNHSYLWTSSFLLSFTTLLSLAREEWLNHSPFWYIKIMVKKRVFLDYLFFQTTIRHVYVYSKVCYHEWIKLFVLWKGRKNLFCDWCFCGRFSSKYFFRVVNTEHMPGKRAVQKLQTGGTSWGVTIQFFKPIFSQVFIIFSSICRYDVNQ